MKSLRIPKIAFSGWCACKEHNHLNFPQAPAGPTGRLELLGHFQVPSQSTSSLFNVLLAHFLPIYFHLPAAGSSGEKTAQGDRCGRAVSDQSAPDWDSSPFPAAPGEEEFCSPWCPWQLPAVLISHRRILEVHFWFWRWLWVWFLLSLSLEEELCPSWVRTGPLKLLSGNVVPVKIPEIALGASLTALLVRGAHNAELLL